MDSGKRIPILFPHFYGRSRRAIPGRQETVQPVGPFLHHGPTFLPVIGAVVDATDSTLNMGQGRLDYVHTIAQGVERRAPQ